MEESLDALEREKDNPGDEVLAAIVRLQLLSDEAHKLLLRDVASAGAAYMGGPPSSDTPSYVFRKNMMSRLQIVKERISPTAATNCKCSLARGDRSKMSSSLAPAHFTYTKQTSSSRTTTSPKS